MNMTAGSPDSAEKVTPAVCALNFNWALYRAAFGGFGSSQVKDLAELLKADAIQVGSLKSQHWQCHSCC